MLIFVIFIFPFLFAGIVLLMEARPDQTNRPHCMMTVTAVESLVGLIGYECKEIKPDSFADVTFSALRPETSYTAYVIADSSRAKLLPLTDEDKAPVQMQLSTMPEQLEVEWSRLSTEMQVVEIKAALRSSWLKEAAAVHYPPIALPADDDIHLEEPSEPVAAAPEAPVKPGTKGGSAPHGKHPPGNPRKGLTSAEDEHRKNTWRTFLNWWVGQNPLVATRIRAEFHLKEILFAGQQSSVLNRYMESGLTNNAEIEYLPRLCATMDATLAPGKMKKDGPTMPASLRKFRSWYKGGQVVRDSLDKKFAEMM